MSLHDELARIAERAPVAEVPRDTWARAQRSRRRDRLAVLTATAAVVALLAGLAGWVPARMDAPVADAERLGVPDHLYGVPERLTGSDGEGDWTSDEVTSDLAVGRAAAAYVLDSGMPVVVDAAEGSYHLLDLPDFVGEQFLLLTHGGPPPVVLSPDGARLAYAYGVIGPDAATEPIPSGIRVVDLADGTVEEVVLTAGEGTVVTDLTWSPDGRWLGFTGEVARSWTAASFSGGRLVLGRVTPELEPDGTTEIPVDGGGLAIADNGRVTWLDTSNRRLVRWDGSSLTAQRVPPQLHPAGAALLADGALAVGSEELSIAIVGSDGSVTTVEAAGGLPPVAGGQAAVVGSVDGRALVRTRSLDDTDGELLLVSPGGASRAVAAVEPDVPDTLTVATDLMTLDRPTVERPAPDWPWSAERWVVVVGTTATAVLLLGVGLAHRRRTRHQQPL